MARQKSSTPLLKGDAVTEIKKDFSRAKLKHYSKEEKAITEEKIREQIRKNKAK